MRDSILWRSHLFYFTKIFFLPDLMVPKHESKWKKLKQNERNKANETNEEKKTKIIDINRIVLCNLRNCKETTDRREEKKTAAATTITGTWSEKYLMLMGIKIPVNRTYNYRKELYIFLSLLFTAVPIISVFLTFRSSLSV